jgi:TatD DNase family protein
MKLIDTHCHIHDPEFYKDSSRTKKEIIEDANQTGVEEFICVGTSENSSVEAVDFCKKRANCYASLALHPHEVANYSDDELDAQLDTLKKLCREKSVVAIGETGLDYYYHDDSTTQKRQIEILKKHILIALDNNLPLIFHIRDHKNTPTDEIGNAFSDFIAVLEQYDGVRGVVHSFSASTASLDKVLEYGLYIGLNGIMTFTSDQNQLESAKKVPIERLLLETDAPFLTPKPFRGKICEPKHLRVTAEFLSNLRGVSLDKIAKETTNNAKQLFGI